MMLPGMLSGTTQKGTVKTWFEDKGFGFISLDAGKDCYFHRTNCLNQQGHPPGTSVTAVIEWDTPKGRYRASTVTITEPVTPGSLTAGSVASILPSTLGATAPGVAGLGTVSPGVSALGAAAPGASLNAATLATPGGAGATANGLLGAMSGMNVDTLAFIQQAAQQLAAQQLAAQQLVAQQAQQAQQLAFGNALANAAFDGNATVDGTQSGLAKDISIGEIVGLTAPAGGIDSSILQSSASAATASPTLIDAASTKGITSNDIATPLVAADQMVLPGMLSGTRQNGTIKKWFEDRGFGFISLDAGNDCYFHRTNCANQQGFPEGTQVFAFIEWENEKGRYRANNVTSVETGLSLNATPGIGPSVTPSAAQSAASPAALLASLGLTPGTSPSATAGAVSQATSATLAFAALVQQKGSGKGAAAGALAGTGMSGEHRFLPYGTS